MPNEHAGHQAIYPHLGYTLHQAANALGQTPTYIKDNFLIPGTWPCAQRGRLILIPGRVILQWMEDEAREFQQVNGRKPSKCQKEPE